MGYLVMQNGSSYQVGQELPPIACFRCGICCIRYRPRLGDDDIARMSSTLGMPDETFRSRFVRRWANLNEPVLDDGGNQCPFLDWDKESGLAKCTVHAFRPQACRSWQASLSRVECQEGLRKIKPESTLILPQDIFSSPQEMADLYSSLQAQEKDEGREGE
jgi:Fe-S-cluster containining protein